MEDSNSEKISFNGINCSTGEYLFDEIPVSTISKIAKGEKIDPSESEYFHAMKDKLTEEHLNSLEETDVNKAGWGIITAPNTPNHSAIIEALSPLLEHRESQVEAGLFKKLKYIKEKIENEEYHLNVSSWLSKYKVGLGSVDIKHVPYYLLLVGSAEEIPFDFQFILGVEYAVGRIYFDTPEEYRIYAEQVVAREIEQERLDKQAILFGVKNNEDVATEYSSKYLIDPLHKTLLEKHAPPSKNWNIECIKEVKATKVSLSNTLHRKNPPALLFTASHGASFDKNSSLFKQNQGALICSDWPGVNGHQGEIPKKFYFSADDIAPDAQLQGMLVFLFACYSGGMPQHDNFESKAAQQPQEISANNFISALPKRLLTAGASAVIAHVDRAWATSFIGELKVDNTRAFQKLIGDLFSGVSVGHAMRFMSDTYAIKASHMEVIRETVRITSNHQYSDKDIAMAYIGMNDARNYILLGDPATYLNT